MCTVYRSALGLGNAKILDPFGPEDIAKTSDPLGRQDIVKVLGPEHKGLQHGRLDQQHHIAGLKSAGSGRMLRHAEARDLCVEAQGLREGCRCVRWMHWSTLTNVETRGWMGEGPGFQETSRVSPASKMGCEPPDVRLQPLLQEDVFFQQADPPTSSARP